MSKTRWIICLAAFLATPAWAARIEGVSLPDTAIVRGQHLVLNGAGVRSVFIFDIYVAALYAPERTGEAQHIMRDERPVRVSMHFIRGGSGPGLLARGWTAGFERNQSPSAMAMLKARLRQFNAMFGSVGKGDVFMFDFLTDHTTRISINGLRRGVIPGADFQRALLGVWLGEHPADQSLKRAMLKQNLANP